MGIVISGGNTDGFAIILARLTSVNVIIEVRSPKDVNWLINAPRTDGYRAENQALAGIQADRAL